MPSKSASARFLVAKSASLEFTAASSTSAAPPSAIAALIECGQLSSPPPGYRGPKSRQSG
jgi:hypothetical protein